MDNTANIPVTYSTDKRILGPCYALYTLKLFNNGNCLSAHIL